MRTTSEHLSARDYVGELFSADDATIQGPDQTSVSLGERTDEPEISRALKAIRLAKERFPSVREHTGSRVEGDHWRFSLESALGI